MHHLLLNFVVKGELSLILEVLMCNFEYCSQGFVKQNVVVFHKLTRVGVQLE